MKRMILTIAGSLCLGAATLHAQQTQTQPRDTTRSNQTPTHQSQQGSQNDQYNAGATGHSNPPAGSTTGQEQPGTTDNLPGSTTSGSRTDHHPAMDTGAGGTQQRDSSQGTGSSSSDGNTSGTTETSGTVNKTGDTSTGTTTGDAYQTGTPAKSTSDGATRSVKRKKSSKPSKE